VYHKFCFDATVYAIFISFFAFYPLLAPANETRRIKNRRFFLFSTKNTVDWIISSPLCGTDNKNMID